MILEIKETHEQSNTLSFDDDIMADDTMFVEMDIWDTSRTHSLCIDRLQAEQIIEHLKLYFEI